MKVTKIVSFDGLNRAGKGTQLKLLRRHLEDLMYDVIIVRGDGSREGVNNSKYFDPPSVWWRKWQENKEKTIQDWDDAYLVLNKEVEDELETFRHKCCSGFFLMDRCYISRWFVERQRNKSTSLEDVISRTQVFPNIYIILDVPKKILLSRQNDDNPKKTEFRRQIVEQFYDLWQDTTNKVEDKLGNSVIRLDGTQDKYDINEKVIKSINIYK